MANLSHLPEQWRQSGLSQQAFCDRARSNGSRAPLLSELATFTYWRAKELDAQRKATDPTPLTTFTEVRLEKPDVPERCIEITYPDGTHVRIPLPLSHTHQC